MNKIGGIIAVIGFIYGLIISIKENFYSMLFVWAVTFFVCMGFFIFSEIIQNQKLILKELQSEKVKQEQ